jgi:hypothetical protein
MREERDEIAMEIEIEFPNWEVAPSYYGHQLGKGELL